MKKFGSKINNAVVKFVGVLLICLTAHSEASAGSKSNDLTGAKALQLSTFSFRSRINVREIDLRDYPEVTFPDYVCYVAGLEKLTIVRSKFKSLPKCLGYHADTLTELIVTTNPELSSIDFELDQMKSLKKLTLNSNKKLFTNRIIIPDMPNLVELDLSFTGNSTATSIGLGTMPSLKKLTLNGNRGIGPAIEQASVIAHAPNLRTLSLNGMNITSVPAMLPFFPNLKKLDLSSNVLLTNQAKKLIDNMYDPNETDVIY